MSLEAIRRSNTGFVAATVFPGFLAFFGNAYHFGVILGHQRSLEVTRRLNTRFVVTTVFPGFLVFVGYA